MTTVSLGSSCTHVPFNLKLSLSPSSFFTEHLLLKPEMVRVFYVLLVFASMDSLTVDEDWISET